MEDLSELPNPSPGGLNDVASPQASQAGAARIARSRRQQAEKRVVCAVLHASSIYGLLALVTSAVVWTTQRSLSRSVAFQALQAMLFQGVTLIMTWSTFFLFMMGFVWTIYGRASVSPGINEPGPTNLTAGALLMMGLGCFWFFQWILPLWGVWAAVRTLRGHSFRYPLVGRLASKWASHQPAVIESWSTHEEANAAPFANEQALAGLVHLSVLIGWSPILAPILWATAKPRSRFLVSHLLQAAIVQLIVTGSVFTLVFFNGVLTLLAGLLGRFLPAQTLSTAVREAVNGPAFCGLVGILGLIGLTMIVSALVASIQAFKGKEFRYPIVGSRLVKYLDAK